MLALAVRRHDAATSLASAAGAGLLLAGRFALDIPPVTVAGSVLLVAAALTNATRCRRST